MSHPKTLHVGAGVLTRYRNGACAFTCRHSGCRAYSEPRSWRAGLRQARSWEQLVTPKHKPGRDR